MKFLSRTVGALGEDVVEHLKRLRFCVVGCGGTGSNFAEMLIRSGATQITLIDGGEVKESDLNRSSSFRFADVGLPKVEALKATLESIRKDVRILHLTDHFRKTSQILDDHPIGQEARDAVYDAEVVFIGTDTNSSRIAVEELCADKGEAMYLSCGIYVDRDCSYFQCAWKPKTPIHLENNAGYGPDNASYAPIIVEAVSVAFSMLLHHLRLPESRQFKKYFRKYDSCFFPIETWIDEGSSGNRHES